MDAKLIENDDVDDSNDLMVAGILKDNEIDDFKK